ncbi:hypothetical protein CGRA01v4_00930 [Colletotrichum graminicola]|nr:hypothetical protein CGRA01v4_00930 [Colletotrichum graminicola]
MGRQPESETFSAPSTLPTAKVQSRYLQEDASKLDKRSRHGPSLESDRFGRQCRRPRLLCRRLADNPLDAGLLKSRCRAEPLPAYRSPCLPPNKPPSLTAILAPFRIWPAQTNAASKVLQRRGHFDQGLERASAPEQGSLAYHMACGKRAVGRCKSLQDPR